MKSRRQSDICDHVIGFRSGTERERERQQILNTMAMEKLWAAVTEPEMTVFELQLKSYGNITTVESKKNCTCLFVKTYLSILQEFGVKQLKIEAVIQELKKNTF